MKPALPMIHLDMYGTEFRRGYDCACVMTAMRHLHKPDREEGIEAMFVRIHKDSLSTVQGVLAENLFAFESRNPQGIITKIDDSEVWIRIKPSRGRK